MEIHHRFTISTDAIDRKGFFDPRYTCDFDNSSPELRWENPPEGTAGFALIAEDRSIDSGNGVFTHWVIYNIPASIHHLPAGIPAQDTLPNGIKQGLNQANKLGYFGPCPPIGDRPHQYYFRIYALRMMPEIPPRATSEQVIDAISPFIILTAEIVGRYQRSIASAAQAAQNAKDERKKAG
jgi:Raf kinase inhibitor-like YbhB/YbcL family protein